MQFIINNNVWCTFKTRKKACNATECLSIEIHLLYRRCTQDDNYILCISEI